MKVCVIGHSLVAPRQHRFWKYIADKGLAKVQILAPKEWLFDTCPEIKSEAFSMRGVEFFGNLRIRGLLDLIDKDVDILFSNEPTYSGGALQAVQVAKELGIKVAVFEWDNCYHTSACEPKVLENANLFIAGCPGATKILRQKGVPETKIAGPVLQVGVDTDLFRPIECKKEFDTVTCAGFTENKGVTSIKRVVKELCLNHLWLGAQRPYDRLDEPIDYGYVAGWKPYEELPEWYNKAKVHVLFSRDTPEWKEQNAPYANLEALACGLTVVMAEAGDAPHFLRGCQAVKLVQQNNVEALKDGIKEMLNYEGESGREFVSENFSYRIIAEKLVKAFENS